MSLTRLKISEDEEILIKLILEKLTKYSFSLNFNNCAQAWLKNLMFDFS